MSDFRDLIVRGGFGYKTMADFKTWDVRVLKFVNKSPNEDPQYAHEGDSGFDLRAWISEEDEGATESCGSYYVVLKPFERRLIHTGIYVELPQFTEAQVRSRSGLPLKQGLVVLNSPGTVDNRYRNEVGVVLINLSSEARIITNGDRIAQMVVMPVYAKELVQMEKVDNIDTDTDRGLNGFGSSGIK